MGARSLALRVIVASCALLLSSALLAAHASAALTHQFISSFGSFSEVASIAIDQSSGDVYVYDAGAGTLYKYTSSGTPAEFSALASNAITGLGGAAGEAQVAVDNSAGATKGDIYIANASRVAVFSSTGQALGAISEETGDPWSEPCGVAVDSSGNVYVGLFGGDVNKYVPGANPVTNSDYASSIGGVSSPCNVAVDSEGNVFTEKYSVGPITRYEPGQFGSLSATGSQVDAQGETMAVDLSSQDLYVDEGGQISQFGPHGLPFEEPINQFASFGEGSIAGIGSFGIAARASTGEVYVSNGHGGITVFGPLITLADVTTGTAPNITTKSATVAGTINPDGVQATCSVQYGTTESYGQSASCATNPGAGSSPVAVLANLTGLEPNTTYHYRFTATNANGTTVGVDQTFTTAGPPVVEREWSSGVGISTATINADINPRELGSTYHFEYGLTSSYGTSVPAADADIGGGAAPVEVSQSLANLEPGTTYHYRVVAVNANGTSSESDRTFTTGSSVSTAESDACPNAVSRIGGFSADLPDCRAYEMVTPLEKNDGNTDGSGVSLSAAADGDRVLYGSRTGYGDTTGSGGVGLVQYVATRNADGWSAHAVTPTPALNTEQVLGSNTFVLGYSSDLTTLLTEAYGLPSVPGSIMNEQNLYSEDTASRGLSLLTTDTGPESFISGSLLIAARNYSEDLGVVTFQSISDFLPSVTGTSTKLYASDHGSLSVAGVMPGGALPAGGSAAPEEYKESLLNNDSISRDGAKIMFVSPTNGSSPEQLYMRKDGVSTTWVSEPETSGQVIQPEGIKFQAMTPDGSDVLFTSKSSLLDAHAGGLYLFTDGPNPQSESNLTFIAEGATAVGMSNDASRIYFLASEGAGLPLGSGERTQLYLWDKGTIKWVAGPVEPTESSSELQVRMSPDGSHMTFISPSQLTSRETGGHSQLYLYDADAQSLHCVSCPPSGAAATSDVELSTNATPEAAGLALPYRQRFLSEDGRYVFFSTADALVPQDTNGLTDAYEYDADTGSVALVSSGTGNVGSWFADASADGSDIFFVTAQQLSSGDTDELVDLYDARVDGGLPEPGPAPVPCAGDACQGTPSAAPVFNTASGFTGLGNLTPQAPVKARAKSKAKPQTRAQMLKRALKVCKRRPKRRRRACEASARKRYAAKRPAKHMSHRAGR